MFNPAPTERLRLHADALPRDAQVLAFRGDEGISTLFAFDIELVSESASLPLQALLDQPAFLAFDGQRRGIHGLLSRASLGSVGQRLTHYHLRLVPHMARLGLRHNHRIFQQRSVAQIIGQVFKEHGILADACQLRLEAPFPARDYCVQYGETDLAFVERLCQEDGIHYRFEHTPDDHCVVFSDHQMHFPHLARPLPFVQENGMQADAPAASAFSLAYQTTVERVELRDHDFRKSAATLAYASRAGDAPAREHFAYPGNLLQTLDQTRGRALAQRTLERCRSQHCTAEGVSDDSGLSSGRLLTLTGHPQAACNQLWLLTHVHHEGHQPQALEENASADTAARYTNTFRAQPWDMIYRPPLTHFKPRVPASQEARVTGPQGEEVYCDAFGRVKVQFHWDREGQGDEHSSCWLRVASGWAGDRHGALTVPRVGMAVLVSFLDDDPDQPVISGCLPDSLHLPPYPLPDYKSRTVLRSRSLGGGGGYNELSMDDRAGHERVYLRAQRDLELRIEHDSHLHIGRQRHALIKGTSQVTLEDEDQRTVTGARKVLLRADDHLTVEQASHTRVGTVLLQHAGQRVQVSADGEVLVEGGNSISLKVAGQHLLINASGIFASSPVQIGGAPVPGLPTAPALPGQHTAQAAPVALSAPVSAWQLALLSTSQATASDYCPLCESCRDGQCLPAGGAR
jgi:type VI secretion system secreted protein VgrG